MNQFKKKKKSTPFSENIKSIQQEGEKAAGT